jgi:hypothetical protein
MFPKDFDPLAQLQQCQVELLRQNRIIQQLITSNQQICDMAVQLTDEYEKLRKELNQQRRDIGTIKILTLDK